MMQAFQNMMLLAPSSVPPPNDRQSVRMLSRSRDENEPDWLNPAKDRKTPYTDAKLDKLAADFLAMNKDVAVWKALIAQIGELEALAVAKQRLAARDPRSLINWRPSGSTH